MVVPFKVLIRKPSFKMENKTKADIKLSNEVPNWSVDDVLIWVRRIGFGGYAQTFSDLGVDGDLLLELDDQQLKEDICISNGIQRKRFVRDLTQLKRKADYSSKDKHKIVPTLLASKHNNSGSLDLMEYAYSLIKKDLSPDLVRRTFSDDDLDDYLREEVNIKSYIHRRHIIDAIFEGDSMSPRSLRRRPQYNSCASLTSTKSHDSVLTENSCDVYVSGGGEHGTHELASLIDINLQLRGFSVYQSNFGADCSNLINSSIEDLTENDDADIESRVLLRSYSEPLERCRNFVLILGAGALEDCFLRTSHDVTRSHLYYEVVAALRSKRVKIVPVVAPGFKFPDADDLVPEVRALCSFNAVTWVHEYQDAAVDKIERFIRGDTFLRSAGSYTNLASDRNGPRTPTMSRSRQDSGRSTPTRPGYALFGNNQISGSSNLLHQLSISTMSNLTLSPMPGSEYMHRFRRDSGVPDSVITP